MKARCPSGVPSLRAGHPANEFAVLVTNGQALGVRNVKVRERIEGGAEPRLILSMDPKAQHQRAMVSLAAWNAVLERGGAH
jgi:hypothetical protein